jgi:hypothetical protein
MMSIIIILLKFFYLIKIDKTLFIKKLTSSIVTKYSTRKNDKIFTVYVKN